MYIHPVDFMIALAILLAFSLGGLGYLWWRGKKAPQVIDSRPDLRHLGDRVKVLERIATDRSQVLHDEIEALRRA